MIPYNVIRTQIDTLSKLYRAANNSGVEIRVEPSEHELRQATLLAELIRGQARPQAGMSDVPVNLTCRQ